MLKRHSDCFTRSGLAYLEMKPISKFIPSYDGSNAPNRSTAYLEQCCAKKTIPMILILLIATGCSTFASDRYSVSMDSHQELKQIATSLQGNGIGVDPFTATEPGRTQIACRAVGPIKTPDGETFEEFLRGAIIDQLQLADLYVPHSTQRISANLDAIDFDSGDGLWSLAVTVTNTTGQSYQIQEEYNYSSSFYGETACHQTAQAFMPAVQNLIRKVIRHQVFQDTIASSE